MIGLRRLVAVVCLGLLPSIVRAAPPAWWAALDLKPVTGIVDFSARWYVVVFLSPECPLSNADIPVLNGLATEFRGKGVVFVGAYADPSLELEAVRTHDKDYALRFATVDDWRQALKRWAGATYTPEVVVFSSNGKRVYRGEIDDRVTGFNAARPDATRRELQDVLAAISDGRPPPFAEVPGFGCTIPDRSRP